MAVYSGCTRASPGRRLGRIPLSEARRFCHDSRRSGNSRSRKPKSAKDAPSRSSAAPEAVMAELTNESCKMTELSSDYHQLQSTVTSNTHCIWLLSMPLFPTCDKDSASVQRRDLPAPIPSSEGFAFVEDESNRQHFMYMYILWLDLENNHSRIKGFYNGISQRFKFQWVTFHVYV